MRSMRRGIGVSPGVAVGTAYCIHEIFVDPDTRRLEPDQVRDELAHYIPRWLNESLALYPVWVKQAVRSNPAYVSRKLSAAPQFINREARRKLKSGDLFQAEAFEHVQ